MVVVVLPLRNVCFQLSAKEMFVFCNSMHRDYPAELLLDETFDTPHTGLLLDYAGQFDVTKTVTVPHHQITELVAGLGCPMAIYSPMMQFGETQRTRRARATPTLLDAHSCTSDGSWRNAARKDDSSSILM